MSGSALGEEQVIPIICGAGVLERRTRDTTEETRRARARNAIGSRKSAEEYEIWLRRLRSEAYIEYRLPDDAEAARST